MPEKSGYEVCEHIKTSEDLKHIPVLLLTGAFEPFDQERAKKAGCDGFLAKPFEPQTLISKVKELLKATAAARPAVPAGPPSPASTIQTKVTPPPPAPPVRPIEEAGDATVMMSPGMAIPPLPSTPASPDATASHEQAGFQEELAVEAGERALSVDADDRTMFLGQPEDTGGADDIWGEVQNDSRSPSSPVFNEDEGQTVMMSSPILPEPIEPMMPMMLDSPDAGQGEDIDIKGSNDLPGGFTELPSTPADGRAGEDDAWVIPGPDPAESAEPELTPLGDFGGFDDFSAEPAATPAGVSETVAPPRRPTSPFLESAKDADTTAQPWGEPPAPPPAAQPASRTASPSPAKPVESFADVSRREVPPAPPAPVRSGPSGSVAKAPATPAPPVAAPEGVDMDALADRVAKKVLSQLSEKVIQEIAWEVVPDLAEALIQKEIEEIKAKIPK
jgi:hypothetical protein